jgi:hypothetical protein
MAFAQMARWLAPAKVQWACSANYLDAIDVVNLSAEQQTLLANIPDPMFRQTTRDFCVNQQFRKDYWIKGARTLSKLEQVEALRAQRVLLVLPRADVSLKMNGSLGEVTLQEAVYGPILDLLAEHKPKTLGQIELALKEVGINFAQIQQAVMLLSAAGAIQAVQDETVVAKAKKSCERINNHLLLKARASNELGHLASPVTGGGIAVPRFHQLFLLARHQGHKQPNDWANSAWAILSAQGQRLVKEGKTLESAEDNLTELTAQAQTFADKQLPILKALQIA